MAEEKLFLPECRYFPTELDNLDINPYAHIGKIVHVLPLEYLSAEKKLTVAGKNFKGIIEEPELSIYPISYFEETNIPKFIPKLFGSCITVRIIGYDSGRFVLSRKSSMQEALQHIDLGQIVMAKKISCIPSLVFLDIGAGISAVLPVEEATSSYAPDISLLFSDMDTIPVLLIKKSSRVLNMFIVSYKQTVPYKNISVGDTVLGRAISFLDDKTGVYVEITPRQIGIVDTDHLTVVDKDDYTNKRKSHPDIILGNTYSFLVRRIRDANNNRSLKKYSLRLIK